MLDVIAAAAAVVAAITVWRQGGVRWDVREQYANWLVVNTGQRPARDVRVRVHSGRRPGKHTDVATMDRVRPGETVPVHVETTDGLPMENAIQITWRYGLWRRDSWEHPL